MAPKAWITYSWADNEGGDFNYLVQELAAAGVQATYDRIELVPGKRLWEQIGKRIITDPLDGWAYLLTQTSLQSEPCREELAYALHRALTDRGGDFPVIGLVHGVRIEDVPSALRVRLCVSLADRQWPEQVKAGLERRAPKIAVAAQTRYVWSWHHPYRGDATVAAVEVRLRFGEVMNWRFAVPANTPVVRWGHGPAGGGGIAGTKLSAVDGIQGRIEETDIIAFGSGDRLSPGVSAYLVLRAPFPRSSFSG